jgi:histidinol-phosphate aminotransferase
VDSVVARIARWVRPEVRALSAYHVADAGGLVKLDAMENPYPWPDDLKTAWLAALRDVSINRYPDAGADGLRERLRQVWPIPAGVQVMLGNGSDELIQLLLLLVSGSGRVVMAPEPTFVMYRVSALTAGMRFEGVPLRGEDFALDLDVMLASIDRHQPAVVFLAYPNNPTGNLWDPEAIHAILQAAPGLVVVDEAYTPFAGASFLEHLGTYPGLVVMRTLSKLGLAGLRLGLVMGDERWIEELNKLRLPYNINSLTQLSTSFALDHFPVFEAQASRIVAERDVLYRGLARLEGVHPWPSQANFILFRVAPGRAGSLREGLRTAGVLIKSLDGTHPLLADCLRVTVGTAQENRIFLQALSELV